MKVVGVIGAGAAGLCAARHISASSCLTPIVWDKASRVGGTWVYTSQVGKDEHGLPIHSSMYKNLKTNLPKEVMAFPDFPFPAKEESFVHHTDVLKYLEDYTSHYQLHQYIKLNHNVEEVKPIERDDGTTGWSVTVQDLETSTTTTTLCDSIIVCNGHYSVPLMPPVKDINKFHGRQIHSHNYREPEPFSGLRVVVLGAAASGVDICLELASAAKEVILSHNHPILIPSELPANVRQARGVVAAYENGFIFKDGSQAEADVIVYCTGYKLTFPFLAKECGVTVEENVVKPLYKHVIHTAFPTMAFIGIPSMIVPFPLFDFQVRFFLALLTGDVAPLTQQEMDANTAQAMQQLKRGGGHERHYHKLGVEGNGHYIEELATIAHLSPVPPYITWMFRVAFLRLLFSCLTAKKSCFSVEAGGRVREWRDGREVNTTLDLVWLAMVGSVRLLRQDFWGMLAFATNTFRYYLGI